MKIRVFLKYFAHGWSLYGLENIPRRNCAERDESSSLVSDIRRISEWFELIYVNIANNPW